MNTRVVVSLSGLVLMLCAGTAVYASMDESESSAEHVLYVDSSFSPGKDTPCTLIRADRPARYLGACKTVGVSGEMSTVVFTYQHHGMTLYGSLGQYLSVVEPSAHTDLADLKPLVTKIRISTNQPPGD